MRITVLGATGQAGSKIVEQLSADGHDVVAASRSSGADVLTGDGVSEALTGAEVLVDATNPPSMEDGPAIEFFGTSARNLIAAANEAGVGHYVALSIVGVDGLQESGYMRGKLIQERTIGDSGLPYTIVRATQFYEFAETITKSLFAEGEVRVPDALIQPIALAAVAKEVARIAGGAPRNTIVNIGGPDKLAFVDVAALVLADAGDSTPVVVDPAATYFGTPLEVDSLVTADSEMLTGTSFMDWLKNR